MSGSSGWWIRMFFYNELLNIHELFRRGKNTPSVWMYSFFILYNIVMSLQFWRPTRSNFMVLAWPLHILLLHSAHHQIFYIWSSWLIGFIWSMQLLYMEEWALLDRDHSNSLSGAIEALKASTLRLPVIGGARVSALIFKNAGYNLRTRKHFLGHLTVHIYGPFYVDVDHSYCGTVVESEIRRNVTYRLGFFEPSWGFV